MLPTAPPRATFSGGHIDRLAGVRKDSRYVTSLLSDPSSRFIPFYKLHPLLRPLSEAEVTNTTRQPAVTNTIGWIISQDLEQKCGNFTIANGTWVLLGMLENRALFAVDITGHVDRANHTLDGAFSDLMLTALTLDVMDASILATARGLLAWRERTKFCAACGGTVTAADGGTRMVCGNSKCKNRQHFPRCSDPSMIVLIKNPAGDKCLLGRGKGFPAGFYSCLAGFVEAGESLEDAVRREVLEEAGVELDFDSIQYVCSQPWPFPGTLMLGCVATAVSEVTKVDQSELEDARWFTRQEVQAALRVLTLDADAGLTLS